MFCLFHCKQAAFVEPVATLQSYCVHSPKVYRVPINYLHCDGLLNNRFVEQHDYLIGLSMSIRIALPLSC